jgi:hypothetical protein
MTPRETRAALRGLPPAERRRVVRALQHSPEIVPLRAVALMESDAVVLPGPFSSEPQRSSDAEDAALLGAERVLLALLGKERGRYVLAALVGCDERPPARLRASVSRATAKLRRALFTEGGAR